MSIVLPTKPVKATRVDPKILLLYSKPKVGKTKQLSQLPGCLILDLEDGAAYYECLKVNINSTKDIDDTIAAITEAARVKVASGATGDDVFPYPFIAVDTMDILEEICEPTVTRKYKASPIGSTFEGKSVLELPNGAGYGLLRKEVLANVMKLSRICKNLILIAHVKDKVVNKGGVEVTSKDISLTGKLGQILCAKVDAIGHMYRDKEDKLRVNFKTLEDNAVMGGRCEHLLGKDIEFDWSLIYTELGQ